jgi:fatty-acyl-CoA synthase
VESDDRHERTRIEPSEPLVRGSTIGDRFDRVAFELPEREALVSSPQQLRYTYQELQTEVDRCARGFLALGVQTGDRIGLWSPISAEGVITQLAAAKVGAVVICLDAATHTTQLHALLTRYGISLLIFAPSSQMVDAIAMLDALCPELAASPRGQVQSETLPALRTVVALGVRRPSGAYNWGDLLALAEQVRPATLRTRQAQQNAADSVAILLTDGAGGVPQGDVVSHQNLLSRAVMGVDGAALTAQDGLGLALQLSQPPSVGIGILSCLTRGATVVLPSPAGASTSRRPDRSG